MVTRLFHIPAQETVSPRDYEAELATVRVIIEYVEQNPHAPIPEDDFAHFGTVTPWVASQLGVYAEKLADEGHASSAIRTAAYSVAAAMTSADSKRLNANLLTYANLLFRFGLQTEAASMYEDILDLPFEPGFEERASARLALANLALANERWQEAVNHWEAAVPVLGTLLEEQVRVAMHEVMQPAYLALDDVAGVIHAANRGGIDVSTLEPEIRTMTLTGAVRLATQLRRHRDDRSADWLTERWAAAHP